MGELKKYLGPVVFAQFEDFVKKEWDRIKNLMCQNTYCMKKTHGSRGANQRYCSRKLKLCVCTTHELKIYIKHINVYVLCHLGMFWNIIYS